MKPRDDHGTELDAIFSIHVTDSDIFLIIESRGGGEGGPRPPRNADYAPAFEILLSRLGKQGVTLLDLEVFSTVTQKWNLEERRISTNDYSIPLNLNELEDYEDFRLQVGRASASLGRDPGKSNGGNRTKRLRFRLLWPAALERSPSELEALLSGVPLAHDSVSNGSLRYGPLGDYLRSQSNIEVRLKLSEIAVLIDHTLPRNAWTPQFWANSADHHGSRRGQWLEAGYKAFFERRTETVLFKRNLDTVDRQKVTDDRNELKKRVKAAKNRMKNASKREAPPTGSARVPSRQSATSQYVRDPEVVAWVLFCSDGICEVCDLPAPFLDKDGEPFLEVHHVRPIGETGPDQVDNAVATCPNCHRKLHFGSERETLRTKVIEKIGRLKDYPIVLE